MMRLGTVSLRIVLLLALGAPLSVHADAPPAPDFNEVYSLVRQHLAGASEPDLNRAAVQGLLSALAPKVSLIGDQQPSADHETALVSKSSLFDGPLAYIRVSGVANGLDKAVRQAWEELAATNKLLGLVIDLRYANGTDYAAAVATADIFAKKEQPLLDWGLGMIRSKEKTDAISLPLAVLVNAKTMSAAEALAAVIRETGAGLILGSHTAGQAMIAQEYPLKNGDQLRIATAPMQLGDGSSLSNQGVKPDISVEVPAQDERAYYADAFRDVVKPVGPVPAVSGGATATGTNRIRRPRFNEAELVRERRSLPDSETSSGSSDVDKPQVHDPVLGRALDFLKGLNVMRQTRS